MRIYSSCELAPPHSAVQPFEPSNSQHPTRDLAVARLRTHGQHDTYHNPPELELMTQGNAPSNMNGLSKHVARPLLNSHHSNSVPSTPYQQARDLRFHSRSPSPNRGLANRSPSSVVSEVVGQPVQPVVCKFETGAEIKRRRIPYVDYGDDGQQGLAAPKKEPKKCLEPDEREKLSGDMRELYDRLLPSDESEERRALLVKKLDRILNEEWPGNDIRVNVFGSSGNLLSSSDSDVDICVTTPLKRLESMHSLATLLHRRTSSYFTGSRDAARVSN